MSHGDYGRRCEVLRLTPWDSTLSNPNTSNEAKEHAREQLKALGVEA